MPTQAKKDGNARHIAKLDVIKIQPYKEEGAAIRAAAAAADKSVQGYVLEAVREKMERERAGGGAIGAGAISIFPDGEDTPQVAVGVSPTPDEQSSPAEQTKGLSTDEWSVWVQRQDDESLESWRRRLNRSHKGLSAADIAKRIGRLPEEERDMLMGTDPESVERLRQKEERERQQREEAAKPAEVGELPF